MVITQYDSIKTTVDFYCEECQLKDSKKLTNLKDNCVIKVEVCCTLCNKKAFFYLLKCNDVAYANTLQSKLEKLHQKNII